MSDDLLDALARLPVPKLDADRRRALAAEVLARADLHDDTRRGPSFVPYAIAAVLAAAAFVLLLGRDEHGLGARIEERAIVTVEPIEAAPAPVVETPARPPVVVVPSPSPPPPPPKPTRQVFGATGDHQNQAIDRETRDLDGAVAAFHEGWVALHAKRYADAIAAFDRATDPAVVEDATFWAAIAAQRAGNIDEARKRLADFLARFPDSPRADRAREVLR